MSNFSFTIRQTHAVKEFSEVYSLSVPTTEGQIQILPGHADLIAESDRGECIIKHKGGEESLKLGALGLIKVRGDRVVLII